MDETAGQAAEAKNWLVGLITGTSRAQTARPLLTDGKSAGSSRWSRSRGWRMCWRSRCELVYGWLVGSDLSRELSRCRRVWGQPESGFGIEEGAEVFGRLVVAAVAFVCVDLGEGFDVVADPCCDRR